MQGVTQRVQGMCSSTHHRDYLQGRVQPTSESRGGQKLSLSPSPPPAVLLVEGMRMGWAPNLFLAPKATAGTSKGWTPLVPYMQRAWHVLTATSTHHWMPNVHPVVMGQCQAERSCPPGGAGTEGLFPAAALQTARRPVHLSQADSTAAAAEGIAGGKEQI